MRFTSVIFISFVILLVACRKTYVSEGTVFSKHNIPVPNVRVNLEIYQDGNGNATTDANGNYRVSMTGPSKPKDKLELTVSCDSGSAHIYWPSSHQDVHLQ